MKIIKFRENTQGVLVGFRSLLLGIIIFLQLESFF